MRYELSDDEWVAIKLMLPNKPRGVPRVNDRRVLNGIFWVCDLGRHGAICRTTSVRTRPATIGFVRWRRAGVWAKIMSALAGAHNAAVQVIDTRA
jgi:transposase